MEKEIKSTDHRKEPENITLTYHIKAIVSNILMKDSMSLSSLYYLLLLLLSDESFVISIRFRIDIRKEN